MCIRDRVGIKEVTVEQIQRYSSLKVSPLRDLSLIHIYPRRWYNR